MRVDTQPGRPKDDGKRAYKQPWDSGAGVLLTYVSHLHCWTCLQYSCGYKTFASKLVTKLVHSHNKSVKSVKNLSKTSST